MLYPDCELPTRQYFSEIGDSMHTRDHEIQISFWVKVPYIYDHPTRLYVSEIGDSMHT